MKKLLIVVALGEAAAGLVFLAVPSLVVPLLFGQEPAGVAVVLARVTGIALLALGVACWPGPPVVGLLIYNAVAAVYLACIGFAGGLTGVLLWPAVVLHVILSALVTWVITRMRRNLRLISH